MKTFEDFLMDKFPFHLNNSNEAFEKWLSDIDIDALISYADEYKNKSLTDYHNHIVEEMEKILTTLCDVDEYTESMAIKDFGKLLAEMFKGFVDEFNV